jgi:hypothetical protein
MMDAETVSENSEFYPQPTLLVAREEFINQFALNTFSLLVQEL